MPTIAPIIGVVHPVFAPASPFPPPPIPPLWWSSINQLPDIAHVGEAAPELAELGTTGAPTKEPSVNKEFHFFDHYGGVETVNPKRYARHFPRPPGRTCGKWTPRHMHDFWTPPTLRAAAPRARIPVLLRPPLWWTASR